MNALVNLVVYQNSIHHYAHSMQGNFLERALKKEQDKELGKEEAANNGQLSPETQASLDESQKILNKTNQMKQVQVSRGGGFHQKGPGGSIGVQ